MKRLVVFVILFAGFNSFGQQRDKNFDKFWPSFRNAVLTNNLVALDTLVSYPVSTRGPMDYDPVKKIFRNKFMTILKKYLSEDADTGGETHQQEINHTTTISISEYANASSGYMRVGDMQFKKVGGKWKLYWLYMAETE